MKPVHQMSAPPPSKRGRRETDRWLCQVDIRFFTTGLSVPLQCLLWSPVSGTPSPVAGRGRLPLRAPRGETSADLPSANPRANFAGTRVPDFRAPDWSRDLRENPSIDPLAAWAYQAGSGWPPSSGRRVIRGWNSGPPCRSLPLPSGRGGRGKETYGQTTRATP